jgi:sulfite exporter TauE/SafE
VIFLFVLGVSAVAILAFAISLLPILIGVGLSVLIFKTDFVPKQNKILVIAIVIILAMLINVAQIQHGHQP